MADGQIPNPAPFSEFGGLSGIMDALKGLFGGGSSSTSDSNSPEGLASAMALLGPLLGELGQGDYSPEAADKDSAGAVQQIIQQMSESGNPIIQGAENASGGYNSTTASLLRNDLAGRIATAGAAEKSNTKTKYAAARQSQIAQVLSLIKIIADAHRTQAIQNQTQGLVDNTNARRAAAAAAALAAARQALKPSSGSKPGGGGNGGGGGKQPQSGEHTPSGRETEEDARQNDPTYGQSGDDILDKYADDGLSGREYEEDARQLDSEYGNDLTADDPFSLLGEIGSPGQYDEFGDFNLGDLSSGDLGDLGGSGDTPDFDFGDDFGNDGGDFWMDDGSDDGDGGGGGGNPFDDPEMSD